MLFTVGIILTAAGGLLCSLAMLMAWKSSRAGSARPRSKQDSVATREEQAPPKWESRLLELETEVSSLSSTFEKALRAVRKREQRDAMRDLRASQTSAGPPVGATKAELRRHFNLVGKSHIEIARMAQTGVPNNDGEH